MPMHRFQGPEVTIVAESFGSSHRPPLLLIMGATASMLGWPDEFCTALADMGFFVIRFDHRDTGESTTLAPGTQSYAVEDMADDVLLILDNLGLERAHLVGMSLGGYIGQIIALRDPDRVASLTLIASEPLGWDGVPLPGIDTAILQHFGRLEQLDWNKKSDVAEFLLEIDALCAADREAFDSGAARSRIGAILARTTRPASMFNHSTVTTRDDWHGAYRRIGKPVLILHGEKDPVLPIENGRALAEGIPGAHIVELSGVGHEIPSPHISRIATLIAQHVRGVEGPRGAG